MGTIKDRNGTDLTEAEDIKKRWWEYTEELYRKDLHGSDNHSGVITHLEPDILEWEVKWTLGSITMNKASGGNGIPAELFQILKDDAVKVLHSVCCKFGKLSSGHRTGKGQFSFQSQRMAMPKNVQTTTQLHSSYMVAKQCLKFSKPGFSSVWTMNFQMFKLDLEKTEEPEIKLPLDLLNQEKREFQKNICFCFIDYTKALDCVDHSKLWKIFRDGNTRPTDLPPEKSVCESRNN